MELPISTILTLAGMAVSVIAAAAIAKQRLASVIEQLGDIETRLRKIDQRVDRHETQVEMQAQRTSVLSGMMSPDIQERRHRETHKGREPSTQHDGMLTRLPRGYSARTIVGRDHRVTRW